MAGSPSGSYDRMARVYDPMVGMWSNGRVKASKLAQLEHMEPGDRVIYVGAGTGQGAIEAARRGAEVTCLDHSEEMVRMIRDRFAGEVLDVDLVHDDLFAHTGEYDVVCANFFFDTFDEDRVVDAVAHTAGLARPGGTLLVADVAVPEGSAPARWFMTGHHWVPFAVSRLQGLTPWFPIYDYPAILGGLGLEVVAEQRFRLWPAGPVAYQNTVARRPLGE